MLNALFRCKEGDYKQFFRLGPKVCDRTSTGATSVLSGYQRMLYVCKQIVNKLDCNEALYSYLVPPNGLHSPGKFYLQGRQWQLSMELTDLLT